ncbi:alpha/beta hydrolase domain-containing protein [Desulfobacterales bacterium HSG2]|nr:alpha/beta hydrolase domain-containing protein [Desulfobacterales bacterium HSG2]
MTLMKQTIIVVSTALCLFMWGCSNDSDDDSSEADPSKLVLGLEESYLKHYSGDGDGGLAHITYWDMTQVSEEYQNLEPEEQAKVGKIQASRQHSRLFQPAQVVAGYEATGILIKEEREQRVSLKVPDNWNGYLIVAGTSGLGNEHGNEAILVPWLLAEGYAYVAGDKGLINGSSDMLSGRHPTQYWGIMMSDLAKWAKERIREAKGAEVTRIYAMGLSNGGYQTRRALEIDHESVAAGNERIFDGGIDWSGTYWADERVLDADNDGQVSVAEYGTATDTLVNHVDRATLTMGWAYSPDTLSTPDEFAKTPRFPDAHEDMGEAGYSAESAVYWGYYNTYYDSYKTALPTYQGIGFYNLVSYIYRAELLGHDPEESQAYSCYFDPENPDAEPPLYSWLANSDDRGWTEESIQWALENANTGEFSAPLITVAGEADALLGYYAQAVPYKNAVEQYGNPDLYRQYVIENAGHVDANADGTGDFDFDGEFGEEGMADRLTPMQAYVQRAFRYLTDWVESGNAPPDSKIIVTDPADDVTDPDRLSF